MWSAAASVLPSATDVRGGRECAVQGGVASAGGHDDVVAGVGRAPAIVEVVAFAFGEAELGEAVDAVDGVGGRGDRADRDGRAGAEPCAAVHELLEVAPIARVQGGGGRGRAADAGRRVVR